MTKQKKPDNNNNKEKQLTRRDFLKAGGAIIASAVLFNTLASCTPKATTTTAMTTAIPTTTSSPTSITTAATTTQPATKTLKIGMLSWFESATSLDMFRTSQFLADMTNQKGGLDIGGEKYNLQIVAYDSKGEQNTGVAAINRLIYEDKVKFIIAEPTVLDPWLPTTETNKVVVCAAAITSVILSPDKHYCFNTGCIHAGCTMIDWYADHYPDLKHLVLTATDSIQSRAMNAAQSKTFAARGITVDSIYYPADLQDLSSIGTKVMSFNPDIVSGGGPSGIDQALGMKAAWDAGYRGNFFCFAVSSAANYAQVAPPEMLEKVILGATAIEFDPPLTQQAQDFKSAWSAKNGKWEDVDVQGTENLCALMAALQKAGSLDPDKVAAELSNGLSFEGPFGQAKMVSRPDIGNNRTVDSIIAYTMKTIVGGKAKKIETISLDYALNSFNNYVQRLSQK